MKKVKTLQVVRLNGEDVAPGQIVDIDDGLLPLWVEKGLATTNLNEEPEKENENPSIEDYKALLAHCENLEKIISDLREQLKEKEKQGKDTDKEPDKEVEQEVEQGKEQDQNEHKHSKKGGK